jgi:KUP system potassium uptake protein
MTSPDTGSSRAAVSVDEHQTSSPRTGFLALTVGSVGVVYGDIGTSPLYAFREALRAASDGGAFAETEVLGVLSLILWALILIVTVKYVLILTRADHDGEGGLLALMALASKHTRPVGLVLVLGLIGTALFYGDAIITPALSVLSAVEGLEVAAPHLDTYVVPITALILIALFAVQSRGTAQISAFFGPITAVWFVAIGAAGILNIAGNPSVIAAINPVYAVEFLAGHGMIGLVTLGAVFLAVTGAEALYADLGHFGRRPIQTAWLLLVLPALTLNYFGQGALVLSDPAALANPFFMMMPGWALWPMVALATAATVIASQAVITGCYSLSRQAIQLGLLPRLEIRHTSTALAGQIYMPRINALLLIGVLLLVALFASSERLASAYGIAVSGTMVVTALLATVAIRNEWRWSLWAAIALMAPFIVIDTTFLAANLLKIMQGGWAPLLLGAAMVAVMATWRHGSRLLFEKTRRTEVPLASLLPKLEAHPPHRVPGTAVFLTSDPESAPTALLHSLKHYKVLHANNAILTVTATQRPRVPESERVKIEPLSETFTRITLRYGFAETPNVPRALAIARKQGWSFDIMSTSFFLSRRSLRHATDSALPAWQDRIFHTLARNADDASSYFQIPTDRVVEIGTQVMI